MTQDTVRFGKILLQRKVLEDERLHEPDKWTDEAKFDTEEELDAYLETKASQSNTFRILRVMGDPTIVTYEARTEHNVVKTRTTL